MKSISFLALFLAPAVALAEAAPASPGQGGLTPFIPLLLIFGVFYFLILRPQQKKAKEHATLMKTLRTGDKIITTSGILGIVVGVKDKSVSIRSADTKLEVLKSAVSEISERGNESASES